MADTTNMKAVCQSCGHSLGVNHTGPCPKCGKEGKIIKVSLSETLSITSSLNWEKRREFFQKNWKLIIIVFALTILGSIVGSLFFGVGGFLVSFAIGILAFFVGLYAATRVREIERGGSQ